MRFTALKQLFYIPLFGFQRGLSCCVISNFSLHIILILVSCILLQNKKPLLTLCYSANKHSRRATHVNARPLCMKVDLP
jgi:hypothetical protein